MQTVQSLIKWKNVTLFFFVSMLGTNLPFPSIPDVYAQTTKQESEGPTQSAEATTATTSKGGLFIEPFLTYEKGELEVDYPSPFGSSTEDIEGVGLGARLGFHVHEIIFLAVDARYSMPNYDSSMLSGDASSNSYNLGATLGVQTPVAGLRVWGTYIADGMIDPDSISNVDIKFSKLHGYRLGAGLYVSMISLNLEYENASYDKSTVQSVGAITGGDLDNINANFETYVLSLSFPVAL